VHADMTLTRSKVKVLSDNRLPHSGAVYYLKFLLCPQSIVEERFPLKLHIRHSSFSVNSDIECIHEQNEETLFTSFQ